MIQMRWLEVGFDEVKLGDVFSDGRFFRLQYREAGTQLPADPIDSIDWKDMPTQPLPTRKTPGALT